MATKRKKSIVNSPGVDLCDSPCIKSEIEECWVVVEDNPPNTDTDHSMESPEGKIKSSPKPTEQVENTQQGSGESYHEFRKKRGPGRPKKRRGRRGKPRKVFSASTSDSATRSHSARREGRPRKVFNASRSYFATRSHSARRGGRPRKVFNASRSDSATRRHSARNARSASESSSNDERLMYESANLAAIEDCLDLDEALKNEHSTEWKKALMEEMFAHLKNKTWEIVERPEGKNIVISKHVLTTKYQADGTIQSRKVRLVARGFTQIEGLDFHETFAPVARLSSIRLLMAMAVKKGWEVHQMDVTTAYLNGDLVEEVYMEIPEKLEDTLENLKATVDVNSPHYETLIEWTAKLKSNKPKVCLLKKALYGLNQSGKKWFDKLHTVLKDLELQKSDHDPCVYIDQRSDATIVIAVYVDDLILASDNLYILGRIKEFLNKYFEMKDLGRIQSCLGIEFKQSEDNQEIVMSQRIYTNEVLKRFRTIICRTISTPIHLNSKFIRAKPIYMDEQYCTYQQIIGSLMYLAVSTRPDLLYTVSMLSQFTSSFAEEHWMAAQGALRYLSRTTGFSIVFKRNGGDLKGFANAEWVSSFGGRKSQTGFAFTMSGGCISWESQKQQVVAVSSTQAEYIAISEAAREAIYLAGFKAELDDSSGPIIIYNDKKGALQLAATHTQIKYIDVRYHYIRQVIANEQVALRYMSINDMPAVLLTKPVPKHTHEFCTTALGVIDLKT